MWNKTLSYFCESAVHIKLNHTFLTFIMLLYSLSPIFVFNLHTGPSTLIPVQGSTQFLLEVKNSIFILTAILSSQALHIPHTISM